MNEKAKQNNSLIPIAIITIAVIAVGTFATLKKQSVTASDSFSQWFGTDAPDFTVTDIDGNKHSISDYRGKNLIVIFWATWCPPCRAEIPHLIELRNQESEDNLAMLAISNEDTEKVKNVAKEQKLNYTVASLGNTPIPRPFAEVKAIPTSFFINPDGKIKTVVVQSLTLKQIKTILNAKTTGPPEENK
ncbi:MAG: TlpA family protein disulfide reductase [Sedimentisphaerales bacterium]|nr:TlpA family protein disulfide reductase [Sedimentisphaerales bacterium]